MRKRTPSRVRNVTHWLSPLGWGFVLVAVLIAALIVTVGSV